MARRHKKVWYTINIPGQCKWWVPKLKKFVTLDQAQGYEFSSHAHVKNVRQLKRILSNVPIGTMYTRWFIKHGKRYAIDFVKVRD